MTPIPASIAVPLVEGLRNDVVVTDNLARTLFPDIVPVDWTTAIQRALLDLEEGRVDTSWSDAAGTPAGREEMVSLESREGLIMERRRRSVAAPARDVYRVLTGMGGTRGWYFANWAWRLRGMLDRMLGGAGLRRGRRHPDDLRVGDAVDFWRVDALEPDQARPVQVGDEGPGEGVAAVRGDGE